MGAPGQPRLCGPGIFRRKSLDRTDFGQETRAIDWANPRNRRQGLAKGVEIPGGHGVPCALLAFPGPDGIEVQHHTLLSGVPLLRVQPEGALGQALQGLRNVVGRFQPVATGLGDFRREIRPRRRRQRIGRVAFQHRLRRHPKDVREKRLVGLAIRPPRHRTLAPTRDFFLG
jgi:hypothetical protein